MSSAAASSSLAAAAASSSSLAAAAPSGGPTSSANAGRLAKLRALHLRRNEARKLNHQEVIEEDRRAKEPKNMDARKRRAEFELQEEEFREKCEAEGKDFEREKLRFIGADEAATTDRRKREKMNPDEGFSSYEDATARKHGRLFKAIKPDLKLYAEVKAKTNETSFYAEAGAVVHGVHKDSTQAIDRMSADVVKQVEKRQKYSRRRGINDDADIDYINERNRKFNEKCARFYGQHTKAIKDNLERGTAV